MFAHTVLIARYLPSIFRVCVHPGEVETFPVSPSLYTDSEPEMIPVYRDVQGRICSAKKGIWFIMDPSLGNFNIQSQSGEVVSGSLFTGKFQNPHIKLQFKSTDKVYGLGAAPGTLLRNNVKYRMVNEDTLFYHKKNSSYATFPFLLVIGKERTYGVYLHTSTPAIVTITVDPDGEQENFAFFQFFPENTIMPVDLFVIQGSVQEIVEQISNINGKPALPPAWALGFHQSRWSYRTQDEVIHIAQKMREYNIPCDAIHLDIHYMDRYRTFTWNTKNFPDPQKMHKELDLKGIRTVAIVDPGIAAVSDFEIYKSGKIENVFCKTSKGQDYIGRVWPGKTVFPDFSRGDVRNWWADLHRYLFEAGVSGIWNDMNEPVLRMGSKKGNLDEKMYFKAGNQLLQRNHYALYQSESTRDAFRMFRKGERPFILSRAGHSGIGRNAFLWTGDARSTWKDLRESLRMILNLGISGMSFTGSDVGGFAGSLPGFPGLFKLRRNDELFVRWLQLGSLMPYFRSHTVLYSVAYEPWAFSKGSLNVIRKHIYRRYYLLPYIYYLAHEAARKGTPLVRPLFFHYTEMEHRDDVFLLGESLLAFPVLKKGQRQMNVLLPPGEWYSYNDGKIYSGSEIHLMELDSADFPLFVKAGCAIPVAIPGRNAFETLTEGAIGFELYPARKVTGYMVLDDSHSDSELRTLIALTGKCDRKGNLTIDIELLESDYIDTRSQIKLRIPGSYESASIDGDSLKIIEVYPEEDGRTIRFSECMIPVKKSQIVLCRSE